MKLGKLKLQSHALLAPLERVSDVGFRSLCYQLGAGITWTEMVRASSIAKGIDSTLALIDTYDERTLTGIQLLASTPKELKAALQRVEAFANGADGSQHRHFSNIRAIDLNFGCPSPDVIKSGAGPALLKRRKRMKELFEVLAEFKQSTEASGSMQIGAVGCKVRLGLNEKEKKANVVLPVIDCAAECGLDYVVVHARHAKQKSSDQPTWESIREAKEHVAGSGMAVIGNGNVFCRAEADQLMQLSGCDGVMMARGAILNPWEFRQFRTDGGLSGEWPTQAEVEEAQVAYDRLCSLYPGKNKYRSFHSINFARLLDGVRDAASREPLSARVPRNQHLS